MGVYSPDRLVAHYLDCSNGLVEVLPELVFVSTWAVWLAGAPWDSSSLLVSIGVAVRSTWWCCAVAFTHICYLSVGIVEWKVITWWEEDLNLTLSLLLAVGAVIEGCLLATEPHCQGSLTWELLQQVGWETRGPQCEPIR